MPDLDLEPLLSALEGESPCGADLEYDPAYMALVEAGSGKPETQWKPAEPPEWPAVYEQALQLARRTRDLRVALWLFRSAARVDGLRGAVGSLQLIEGLLERYWGHVHPMLEGKDATARTNALATLVHPDSGLADLRQAALTPARGSLRVRDLELAAGKVEPLRGEPVPSREGARQGVADALAADASLAAVMRGGLASASRIEALIDEHVGAEAGIDFAPLTTLLRIVADAAAEPAAAEPAEESSEPNAIGPTTRAASVPGSIASREDAVQALQRVCDWLERHEPSNPAPLLIRRAQRLMSKNFLEIMRDLAPEGVDQIEKLAGIADQ